VMEKKSRKKRKPDAENGQKLRQKLNLTVTVAVRTVGFVNGRMVPDVESWCGWGRKAMCYWTAVARGTMALSQGCRGGAIVLDRLAVGIGCFVMIACSVSVA